MDPRRARIWPGQVDQIVVVDVRRAAAERLRFLIHFKPIFLMSNLTKSSQDSLIAWTKRTWNPWHGCIKVSAGCKFCYMYRDKAKYGQDAKLVTRSKTKFREPLKWKEPQLVFTCSWSDWFIEQADSWRAEAWEIIKATPHHTYQILTKRPERIQACLPSDWGDGYPNVWLGVSAENQATYEDRAGMLCTIPAAKRFLSCEPLLGPIKFAGLEGIDWVIIGGESGNDNGQYLFRSCELGWIESIIEQTKLFGSRAFVKQLGTHLGKALKSSSRHGTDPKDWPPQIRVQEWPAGFDVEKYFPTPNPSSNA